MLNKQSSQRGGVGGITGEGASRHTYKGHMDKAKGVGLRVGGGGGWGGGHSGMQMETTIPEQQ